MRAVEVRQLQQKAAARGVRTFYRDMAGQRQNTSPEVLRAMLEILGPERTGSSCLIEPVYVMWAGRARTIDLRPRQSKRISQSVLRTEAGDLLNLETTRSSIHLPRLPLGYYTLLVETPTSSMEALVISAPLHSYSHPAARAGAPERGWGVFAPMYALHSSRGASDFATWREFIDWLDPLGASVVATMPLLAAFLDAPACEPSPYSPASRLFWNEFYVEPEGSLRGPSRPSTVTKGLIDYPAEAKQKRRILADDAQRFFQNPDTPRFREFQGFLRGHPHLEQYSRFRAAREAAGRPWHTWPEPMRAGKLGPSDYREADKNYHAYAQWLAQRQMDDLLAHCRAREIKFYLDLPLGVHPDGYDVWRERETFALGASAGAPPDAFFTRGQDWGFPPLHPERLRETKYRYFIDYVRFQMRHTGLLRIDHVMGLHRLYWIPRGRPAKEGAYVSYPAEELYAILCLESHRNQTMLVGENLGTVPPEVNQTMARHHLRQTYVLQYELPKLRRPPVRSIASLNTHDMPPFAAFMRGDDIRDRHKLGLVAKQDLQRELDRRRRLVSALRKFLRCPAAGSPRALLQGSLRWLSRSSAEFVLINLEDLWLESRSQNVPGTSTERPNWRRRTRLSLDQIKASAPIRKLLRTVSDER